LRRLILSNNQLTGSIPPELGSFIYLQYLLLNNNQLNGSLPIELMNLTSLYDYQSDFCNNYLYTDNAALRDFLNTKQIGGDWESCQLPFICECDINVDGKCDMQDWLLFGEDWGRTDCPIP